MKLKEKMTNVKGKKLFKRIDPISLALVVLLGASAVFAGVQLYVNQSTGDLTVENPANGNKDDLLYADNGDLQAMNNTSDAVDVAALGEVISSPLESKEIEVTKYYYSDTVETDVQTQSFFYYPVGQSMYSHESKGMSFKSSNDEVTNVVASLTGTVSSVKDEILKGTIVTIEHANGVKTVYTGVYDVKVNVGDTVSQGDVLGVTGLSQLEPDAGNVVHFEIMKNDVKMDPQSAMDKKLSDL